MHAFRTRAVRNAVTLLLAVAATACGVGQDEEEAGATPLILTESDVAVARLDTLHAGVTLTGTLDPYLKVDVRAQVSGTVSELAAERGDQVGQDQVLARIEAEGIQGQAMSAQAGVAAAESGVAQAIRQLESARTLRDAGAMSDLDFQAVETSLEAARAQLASARAAAAGAAEQARRTVIRAPIQGEVSERSVSQGEAVNSNQLLFTVVNSSLLELSGQVPVRDAVTVREGMNVEFVLDAYPGRTFRGVVSHLSPVADPRTRQVGVTMRLENPDRSLIGGLFASGRVITETRADAVVIPAAAIRGTNGERFVWLLAGGVLTKRPVDVGPMDETSGMASIVTGLSVGDSVVVAPGEVQEGSSAQVVNDPLSASASAKGEV